MKVAVLGHHPDLFPGFNALMTANMAYGFSKLGAHVTIYLPDTKSHPQRQKLRDQGRSTDDLDRFGADYEIIILEESSKIEPFDLGIWQSYFPDDEAFFDKFKAAGGAVAKNFPRLLIGDRKKDLRTLAATGNRFDLIGFALRTDYELAKALSDELPDAATRSLYMPRGFRSDWFMPPTVEGPPVFGVEKGVGTDNSEYTYLIPVVDRLREKYGRIEVIGARLNDGALVTSHLSLLSARQFYRQFLNPLWAYLMIDVDQSRQSMNAVVVDGRKVYPGMYENQVVESQLAGAAVLGHRDALPRELVASDRVALRFDEYGDADAMVGFLSHVIENRATIAQEATKWAQENHSVESMVRPLFEALLSGGIPDEKEQEAIME
jgi:hypothetical protein